MKEIFLGTLIKKRRNELNLSQENLCLGICEPVTISRLENGQQFPRRHVLTAIMDRLDLPSERYFAIFRKEDDELLTLQTEIDTLFKQSEKEISSTLILQIQKKLEQLEKCTDKNDSVILQFLKAKKLVLMKYNQNSTTDEQLKLALEALKLTEPKIDLEHIDKSLLTLEEINILNEIAKIYSLKGLHTNALSIYTQLLNYMQNHFRNIKQSGKNFTLTTYNYAQELFSIKDYKNACIITNTGIETCINHGHYHYLAHLTQLQANSLYYLGNLEESKDLFFQAYYIYEAIGNFQDRDALKLDFAHFFDTKVV